MKIQLKNVYSKLKDKTTMLDKSGMVYKRQTKGYTETRINKHKKVLKVTVLPVEKL